LSWSTPFDDPIVLPNGRKLVTLEDAARYIQKLPKATHDLPHWQDAVEHLMRASAGSPAWLMFARIVHAAGDEPRRRAGVQRGSQRDALGQAEAEAGSIAAAVIRSKFTASPQAGIPEIRERPHWLAAHPFTGRKKPAGLNRRPI